MRNEHDRLVARYLRNQEDEAKRASIDRIARIMHEMNARDPIRVAVTVQPASMISPIDPRRI